MQGAVGTGPPGSGATRAREDGMRRWRCRLGGAAAILAVALLAVPLGGGLAPAMTMVELRGLSCTGVTAIGVGLPAGTTLQVTLRNDRSGAILRRRTVTTDAAGAFTLRLDAPLAEVRSVTLLVARPGGSLIAWTRQTLHSPCAQVAGRLARTGAAHIGQLLGVGLGWLALGTLLLYAFAYPGRHVRGRKPGRHVRGQVRPAQPPG
jgi:hypothetical protein